MINDSLFEMSDSDLNRFEMIYVLSFRNDREKFWSPDRRDGKCKFPSLRPFYFRQQAGKSMFS